MINYGVILELLFFYFIILEALLVVMPVMTESHIVCMVDITILCTIINGASWLCKQTQSNVTGH